MQELFCPDSRSERELNLENLFERVGELIKSSRFVSWFAGELFETGHRIGRKSARIDELEEIQVGIEV